MERIQISFQTSNELAKRVQALLSISILTVNGITCRTTKSGSSVKVMVTAPKRDLLSACNIITAFYKEERTDQFGKEAKLPKTPKAVLEVITKAHENFIKPPLNEEEPNIPFDRLA